MTFRFLECCQPTFSALLSIAFSVSIAFLILFFLVGGSTDTLTLLCNFFYKTRFTGVLAGWIE